MYGLSGLPQNLKGEVFAYVGSIQNLKDLKDLKDRTSSGVRLCWELEEPEGHKGLIARQKHGLSTE